MAHGLLHYCGYGDKKKEKIMRLKEDEKNCDVLRETIVVFSRFHGMLFHVEHIYIFIFLYQGTC
jgi:uncharacterized protein involved in tellurium resistance